MDTRRWLVPFTWGVDMQAIDSVARLAEGGGATLVAVSLISRPDKPGRSGPRLEHIQQSKDFLEAIKWKADGLGVALERHEVITVDIIQSVATIARELHCDAIVLVSRGEREALLRGYQLKHLLVEPPVALLVLRLAVQDPAPTGRESRRESPGLAAAAQGTRGSLARRRDGAGYASAGRTPLDSDGGLPRGMSLWKS